METTNNKQQVAEQKELLGRNMYKLIFSADNYTHFFAEEHWAPWDVITNNVLKDTRIIAEIKKRGYDLKFFKYNKPYLEKKKLEGIKTFLKENETQITDCYYVNLATDAIQIFKIDLNGEYEWQHKYLPFDDFSDFRIWKWVVGLPDEQKVYEKKL